MDERRGSLFSRTATTIAKQPERRVADSLDEAKAASRAAWGERT
jgi:hypothetical protein